MSKHDAQDIKSGGKEAKSGNSVDNNEELTIEQLKEKLLRKELEEKLKEKHKDSSILGVCHTCHFPIYHGEAIYTPHDYSSERTWHAEGGGVVSGADSVGAGAGAGAGGVRGGDKRHSVSEGWIQCGFCYQEYHKELQKIKDWEKSQMIYVTLFALPAGLAGITLAWFLYPKEFSQYFIIFGLGGCFVGFILASTILIISKGLKPTADRYKLKVKERKAYELKTKNSKI